MAAPSSILRIVTRNSDWALIVLLVVLAHLWWLTQLASKLETSFPVVQQGPVLNWLAPDGAGMDFLWMKSPEKFSRPELKGFSGAALPVEIKSPQPRAPGVEWRKYLEWAPAAAFMAYSAPSRPDHLPQPEFGAFPRSTGPKTSPSIEWITCSAGSPPALAVAPTSRTAVSLAGSYQFYVQVNALGWVEHALLEQGPAEGRSQALSWIRRQEFSVQNEPVRGRLLAVFDPGLKERGP